MDAPRESISYVLRTDRLQVSVHERVYSAMQLRQWTYYTVLRSEFVTTTSSKVELSVKLATAQDRVSESRRAHELSSTAGRDERSLCK